MEEIVLNLHMHTRYSDGTGLHADLARAALDAGVDVLLTTDHNVLVNGVDGYFKFNQRRVLLIAGEEIHDRTRIPQKNHLLVFNTNRELTQFAADPQRLIDQVTRAGGLSFIAHPIDPAMPAFHEDNISWENWSVNGFTGMEIWNGFSELKVVAHTFLQALFYAFFPQFLAHHPVPETLQRWDEQNQTRKVVGVCGSDAHELHKNAGPIHKKIFPYAFHFRAINNHLLTPTPLSGDLIADKKMIFQTLAQGRSYIGYDLPLSTRGFRFTAQTRDANLQIGDETELRGSATLQIRLPERVECRLLRNGQVIQTWNNQDFCTHITSEPGVYRVECFIDYLGQRRGWIYSNPIYLRKPARTFLNPHD